MISQIYTLRLVFAGPLLSQASGTLVMGVDTAMQRDAQQRPVPVLNGSLVRGNIRHALKQFTGSSTSDLAKQLNSYITQWFGRESSAFEPQRAQVQFDFFWHLEQNTEIAQAYRTRIQIDETGKVKEGALQVLEDCFPLGTTPAFVGKLRAQFADEVEQAQFERALHMALDFIPAMGSLKGIGFGRLLTHSLDKEAATLPTAPAMPTLVDNCFGIRLTLDRPFCLGKPRTPESNRIESSQVITGQVIKAVLAQAYGQDQKRLEEELSLDRLIISHCHPVKEAIQANKPSLPLPLSLAYVDGELQDLSMTTAATYTGKNAVIFQPDWKSEQETKAQESLKLNQAYPERLLVVRTAIDAEQQTAQESELFSLECIDPTDYVWCGTVSLANIPTERQARVVQYLHQCFSQGLQGIGKTKAYAKVEYYTPNSSAPWTVTAKQTITLTLSSPARLFPLGWERMQPNATARQLHEDYWNQVSNQSLKLVNFFAQQQRLGGQYHYHHFQLKADQTTKPYQTEWLTSAGSVFSLEVLDAKQAQTCLQQWLSQGLPVPEGNSITWQDSPYLPEHGYGEVLLNWQPLTASTKGVAA